ncbi:hypothetical protein BSKO_04822 [Bryopsis sp. KO-2023]|nr:hypothetical protein BSKO_04822 [Bryopsis sp. KO-2023]
MSDHKRGAHAGETSYVANHEGVPMRRKALHRSRRPTSRILKWMGIRSCFCSQPEKPTKPETKTVDPLNQGAEWSNPPSHSKERTSRSVSFKKHAPDISDHIRQFNDPKYDATNYQSCAISRYFQSLPADWDSEFLVEKQLSEKREQRLFSTKSGRCENDGKSMSDSAAWTTMEHLERFFSMEGATKSIHHSIGGVDHGVSNGAYHFDGEVLDENGPTRMEPSNMNFRAHVSLSRPMSATWTAMQATT